MSTFWKHSLLTPPRCYKSVALTLVLLLSACASPGPTDQGLVFGIDKETLERVFPNTISWTESPHVITYAANPGGVDKDVKTWLEPEGLERYPDFEARLTAYKGAMFYSAQRLDEADAYFALALEQTKELTQSCSAEQTRILALMGQAFVAASRAESLKSEKIRGLIAGAANDAGSNALTMPGCKLEMAYLSIHPLSFLVHVSAYDLEDYELASEYIDAAAQIAENAQDQIFIDWVMREADHAPPLGFPTWNVSQHFESMNKLVRDHYAAMAPANFNYDLELTEEIWVTLILGHYWVLLRKT